MRLYLEISCFFCFYLLLVDMVFCYKETFPSVL